jgi:hypothetical protein
MATIGKVSAVFTASTAGLTTGVNSASAAFKSLQSDISGLRGGMSALVAINAAQFFGQIVNSASAAIGSMVRMGQAQAEVIDQTSKLASRLGMTYGELSGIALAGDLAGVGLEAIGAAATKADVAFVKATNGSKAATAAFAGLGLTVQQLSGLNAADRFEAIASAIAAIPSEADRAAAAVQIFGRAGAGLLPLFSGGADAIAAAREEADRFGLSLTTAQGQAVEAMNDAITRSFQAVRGVGVQVVAQISPYVQAVADSFTEQLKSTGGDNIGKAIASALIDGARYLAEVADFVVKSFREMFFSAADILGVSVSEEAKKLKEMQAALAAGTAPQSIIPGSGGFVTQLDPAFSEEMKRLTDVVAAQRQTDTTFFTDLVKSADEAFKRINAVADGGAKPPEPLRLPPIVIDPEPINQAIKGIDSRSAEGVAEMFRLMRGQGADVQQQQLTVLEKIAENTAGGDDTYAFALD